MTTVYHTAARQGAERFRFWRGLMCRTFAPADGRIVGGDDFDAHFTVNELGPTTVCTVSGPRQIWERSARHIRHAPRNEYLFTQVLSGSGVLRQNNSELILRPGAMAVYDVDQPYSYEVAGDVLFVKLPRRQMSDCLGRPGVFAQPLDHESELASWACGVVRSAAALEPPASARTAEMVGNSVLSAVAALLSHAPAEVCSDAAPVASTTLTRICAYLSAHLSDPELSLASIARSQGISERSLNRLFAAQGTTPMKWVLQQRLARSLLLLQQDTKRSVTDIAFSNGFNDLSHFSRVFKKAYLMSPHKVASRRRPS